MAEAYNGSPRAWARLGGIFYAITFAGGLFADDYARPGIFVRDNAVATADNIMASEPLYRLAIAADLLGVAAHAAVTAVLYVLLKPVSRNLSLMAAFFSIAGIAVGALSLAYHIAPLILLSGRDYLSPFSLEQLQALSLFFIKLRGQSFTLGMVFFGFYCILIGWLIFRSTFFPRLIGVVLAAGGVGYLLDVFTTIVDPALSLRLYPYDFWPGLVGEMALALWLLLVGVNSAKWKEAASSPSGQSAGFVPSTV